MVFSVFGALTVFGPWLTIDYYDQYGYIYESYNGFTLFSSGLYFGPAMFIPIAIAILFIFSFLKFRNCGYERRSKYFLIMFIVIFVLSWIYNMSVIGVYDNYPYFTEYYDSGLAEETAIIISIINLIIACVADSKIPIPNVPEVGNNPPPCPPVQEGQVNFCPNCGTKLSSENGERGSFCPNCGSYIGNNKEGDNNNGNIRS